MAQFIGEGLFTMGAEWPARWSEMSNGVLVTYMAAATVKFLGRGGCVLIPMSAVFVAHTYAQVIMGWVMVGVAAVYAADLMGMLDSIVGKREKNTETIQLESELPFIDLARDPAALVIASDPRPKHNWRREKMV